jgi:DNA polymerase-3 subunit epsilon
MEIDFRELESAANSKMAELSLDEKFEEAIEVRDRYAHLRRAASRIERLNSIAKLPELIVAKPIGEYWEFASIKYGRLAASNVTNSTTSVTSALSALELLAEKVENSGFLQQVNYEEVELILNYLESDGIRLVKVEGEYAFPVFGPTSQSGKTKSYELTIA